jgi:hypothetical protein
MTSGEKNTSGIYVLTKALIMMTKHISKSKREFQIERNILVEPLSMDFNISHGALLSTH